MRLLIFEPYSGGHQFEYVAHILRGWRLRKIPGQLGAAVTPGLLERHPNLLDLACEYSEGSVSIHPILHPQIDIRDHSLLTTGLSQRRMLRALAREHRPEHILCLYLDHAQLAFAMGTKFPRDVRFFGILLRPTLTAAYADTSLGHRLRDLRKRLLLKKALRHPALGTVYSLDPFAVAPLRQLAPGMDVLPLADPLYQPPPSRPPEKTRTSLEVESGRRMGLLFGSITRRKGIFEVLQALEYLDAAAARRLTLVIAGTVAPELSNTLRASIRAMQSTPVQLIVRDAYLSDRDAADMVHAADFLLLPYQRHIGSSGVLIRAAAAGRPVIAQDYGLIGELTRTLQLGLTVDTANPEAIAKGIQAAVSGAIKFDSHAAAQFAADNSIESFLDTLLGPFMAEPSG